jgi:hypothetical protein
MTGRISPRGGALLQTNGLETTTPQTLRANPQAPATNLPENKVDRTTRRRRWQEDKIRDSRTKKKRTPVATEPNSLEASRSLDSEADSVQSATQKRHNLGGRVHALHDRTESQWKTIRELELCARCLTLTTPPHKLSDEDAHCNGQPNAPWSEAEIRKIRKWLRRKTDEILRKDDRRRMASKTVPREHQRQPAHALLKGNQHEGRRHSNFTPELDDKDNGTPTSASSHAAHARVGGPNLYAPLYNLHVPSSYIQRNHGPTPDASCTEHSETQSQFCGLRAAARVGLFANAQPGTPPRLQHVRSHPRTPVKHPGALNIDLSGMDMPTPLTTGIPEIHIEGHENSSRERYPTMMTDWSMISPISSLMSDEPDWDVKADSTDGFQRLELRDVVVDDLTSSEQVINKLLLKERQTNLSLDRSWTLKGMCPSLVSHVPGTQIADNR